MRITQKQCVLFYRSFVSKNVGLLSTTRYLNQVTLKQTVSRTEQMDFLKEQVQNQNIVWNEFKNSVLHIPGTLNEKNIDAVILKVLVSTKKFDSALSFATYLKTCNQDLSLGVINGLLSFYYEYAKENTLSGDQKDFILTSYTNLHDKYKILDGSTNEKLLHALCTINEWQKCLKIIEDIFISNVPSHSTFSTLIGTLFRNNKKAEALKLIDKSIKSKRPLLENAYEEWINYIFRKYKDKKTQHKYLNDIFNHISDNCVVVSAVTAQLIKESYEKLNYTANFTEINKHSGQCAKCNQVLDCLKLSEEEFTILQNVVKEKLIIGSDLFLKSSPTELKKFLVFIERNAPFDIVLDGLNIAFTARDPYNKIRVLKNVVDHFAQQKKKILLLGRKHMLKWQRGALFNIMKKTENFFIDDISQDDPYFITAAILSGSHTDLVSRDLLRGHRFLLEQEKLQRLFQRWQWQHQWMVFLGKFKPVIQPPLKYTPLAQQGVNGWHMPYLKENVTNMAQVGDGVPDCTKWLCLKSK